MPTEEDDVQYLYLVLTAGGPPVIDWDAVAGELSLKKGAATKRWSRLRQAMEKKTNPGPTAQQLLWLCVKHSSRDKALDWNDIAQKCNTTAGAASKRYSRMKLAFENGTAVPPSAPTKGAGAGASTTDNKSATTSVKRKRGAGAATKSKKAGDGNEEDDAGDNNGTVDDAEEKPKAKRARGRAGAGKKTVAKAKVKTEGEDNEQTEEGTEEVAVPPRSLIDELDATVEDIRAKYHGGAGAGGDGDDVDAEGEDDLTQARMKVNGWLESI